MNCVLCHNGTTEEGFVTVTLEKNKSIILLKNVPAQVCSNCGHYYLSEATAREILQKGNDALAKGAELEIVNLQVA
jgi:YgiT-type zinc finger domain-containing protein